LGRLELQARSIVEGLLAGRHRSPFCGQSVEFVQHRQYAWGDELRHVDWRVWARHDRLYVKQFEENTNLRLTLMVDASASMSYGQVGASKFDCAATLAACLAYLVLRQQDDVGCVTFDQRIRHRAAHRNHWGHLETILSALDQSDPREKTSLLPPVLEAASLFPQKGIWVIVSDLLIEPEELADVLRFLRSRGQEVVVFHVLHEDELDFPFSAPSIFEDCETALRIRCTPSAFRQGYLEALEKFLDHVREVCSRLQTEYYLVRRSDPLELPLLKFLAGRSRLARGLAGRRKL
jgi:uncharacterized protein (DUF58 family)